MPDESRMPRARLVEHLSVTLLGATDATLRAAFLEGNCSWLPFLMWRMDEHWERTGDVHAPELKMAPSAYWKRHHVAAAQP